jgi:hypothetical protein
MAIDAQTVAQLVREIADALGDNLVEGTATAGASGTLTDTVNVTFEETNELEGGWIAILAGTSIGDERNIKESTAAGLITPRGGNWTAQPDTTSKYVVTKQWRPTQYVRAIAAAIRAVQHSHVIPLDDVDGSLDELITLGDILSSDGNGNGQMEKWANGAALAPDGWTAGGSGVAVARESGTDNVRRGTYSAKVTSSSTNVGQLSQSIRHFERYAGQLVTFKAWLSVDTTTKALIRVGDGGVSTAVTAVGAAAALVWEELSVDFTLDDDPKGLDVDLECQGSSAVVAYWDDVRLLAQTIQIFEYDLVDRLVFLAGVQEEMGSNNEAGYREELIRRAWRVEQGASPKLIFKREFYTPLKGQHVRLRGQAHPASITVSSLATAFAETVEVNPDFVIAYAKWFLWNAQPADSVDEQWRLWMREQRSIYQEMEAKLGVRPLPGSVRVQVL